MLIAYHHSNGELILDAMHDFTLEENIMFLNLQRLVTLMSLQCVRLQKLCQTYYSILQIEDPHK